MTTRDSQDQIETIHGIEGIEASPSTISAIADAGMDAVTAWGNRLLEPMLSDRLHGSDPGRYSQVSNTGRVRRLGHPVRWDRGRLRPVVSGQ